MNGDGIDRDALTTVTAKLFRSAYSPARYSSPLVLLKANASLPCVLWNEGFLAYRDKIIGLHAPKSETKQLTRFCEDYVAQRGALMAFCLLESTQLLVGKSTAILKRDVDNFPWPQGGESWDLSAWEKTLCEDLVEHVAEYVRLGQDSKLLKQAANADDFTRYAETFCGMLRSIYPNLHAGRALSFDGLTCQSFYFGEQPDLDWPEDWSQPLHKLVYVRHGEALRTVRVLRFYESNVLLIVKPDRLRYWIRSTAIRDADETLLDLRQQGF